MSKPKGAMAITVHFKASIRTDGELVKLHITQGEQEILLTGDQAISLMKELIRRFSSGETSTCPTLEEKKS